MMRWKVFLILISVLFLRCAKPQENSVVWSPLEPKEKDEILISYNPKAKDALIKDPEGLVLIYEIEYPDSQVIVTQAMEKKEEIWQGKIRLKDNAYFLGFKFEDRKGRTFDNNGFSWNLIVRSENEKVPMNAYYALGLRLDGFSRPEAEGDYEKAWSKYEKELEFYPENYKVWIKKWRRQLRLTENGEKLKEQIENQIDALIKIHHDNSEILYLAYSVYSKLIGDEDKSKKYGGEFIDRFPDHKEASKVAWVRLHLKYGNNWDNQIEGLKDFAKKFPKSELTKTALWRLAIVYEQRGKDDKACHFYEKTLEVNPSNVPVRVTLAEMHIEKNELAKAQELLDNGFKIWTMENFTKIDPWHTFAFRKFWLDNHLSDLYFTQGKLFLKKEEFGKAIESWNKALSLNQGWQASILTHLGKAYQLLGEKNKAKEAYLQALISDPLQEEAEDSLLSFYKLDRGTDSGFKAYLKKEILKKGRAIAQPAPDFEAFNLYGEKFRLSQMKGKVVILYFWHTECGGCRAIMPEINKLYQELKDEPNVVFWAISDEGKNILESFLKKNEFGYHPFYGGRKIRELYGMVPFPTHIIIDSDGLIRYRHIGPLTEIKKLLKYEIETLLKEKIILGDTL